MQRNKWSVIKSSAILILGFAAVAIGQISSPPYIARNQSEIDSAIWGPKGDGVANDTVKLQAAIDFCILNQRTLLIRRPPVAYKISHLHIGPGTYVVYGFDMKGIGQPRFISDGTAVPMFDIHSVAEARFENLWLDGNLAAGVNGITVRSTAPFPSQRLTFRNVAVQNCPVTGVRLTQAGGTTCDYMVFENCNLVTNGIGLQVEDDMRAVTWRGGTIADNDTYGIAIVSGHVNVFETTFSWNHSGSFHLASNLSGLSVYRSVHEDHPILTGSGTWNTYGPLLTPIVLDSVKQDPFPLPYPAGNSINYNAFRPLVMSGCSFVRDVEIGADSLCVTSINTEFTPFAYSGINANFTNHTEKLAKLGRGAETDLPDLSLGAFFATVNDLPFSQEVVIEFDGSWDNESWPLPIQIPRAGAMTLIQIDAYAVGGGTLNFNLQERAEATINTPGSDVWAAVKTATAAGLHQTTFTDAAMAAGAHLWWTTPAAAATGTVDAVVLKIQAR